MQDSLHPSTSDNWMIFLDLYGETAIGEFGQLPECASILLDA